MNNRIESFYARYLKRITDIFCAISAILVFSWLYVIIAILVWKKLGRPVIFKQERPGRINPKTNKEVLFNLYKFRSMNNATDIEGKLLPDSERLTKFGEILRATSLDELPEVWNILKGDLSIVGPRPLAVQYLPYYTDEERRRHIVRPGLTGLAQVNGRNGLQWEERFAYDLYYVDNISFANDIKIILLTIKKVLKREDVSVRGTGKTVDFDKYRQNGEKYDD